MKRDGEDPAHPPVGGARLRRGTGTPTAPPPRPLLAWTVTRSIRGLGRLPLRSLQTIGTAIGGVASLLPLRERRVTEVNLSLAFPELDERARRRLVRRSMIETAKTFAELSAAWTWDRGRFERHAHELHGETPVLEALEAGRGVIVAGPHLGNWEVGGLELAARFTVTSVYQPPRLRELEGMMLAARERFGARLVPAGGRAIRALMAALGRGEVVGILPDQDPSEGMGIFVPFFGVEANTMTLLPKLARRTGALVVAAYARRLPRGRGFDFHFFPAGDEITSTDLARSATELNRTVERCIRHCPEQYMWSYKRFRTRPPGSANPYAAGR